MDKTLLNKLAALYIECTKQRRHHEIGSRLASMIPEWINSSVRTSISDAEHAIYAK